MGPKRYLCIVKLCILLSKFIKILIWNRFEHYIDLISLKCTFTLHLWYQRCSNFVLTKCSDLFFHISTSKYFESTFLSLYQKQFHFFIGFWVDNLFCLLYLVDTPPFEQKMPLTSLKDPKFPCIFMKMKKTSNIIN